MHNEDLYNNGFLQTVMGLTMTTLNDVMEKDYKGLTELQRYLFDFNMYNNRLLNTLNEIGYITIFLRCFPLKSFYKENDITEEEYIKYHLESYFHKLFIVRELFRCLINSVYDLKLERPIMSNLEKKLGADNKSIILLNDFETKFYYYRVIRNEGVHKGLFRLDEEFDNLSFIFDFNSFWDKVKLEKPNILLSEFDIEIYARNYRKKKVEIIHKNLIGIERYIDLFYHIWNNVFYEKAKEISNSQ